MSGSGNSQPSTLKSYTDSGIAAVQGVVGSLTGKYYRGPWISTIISNLKPRQPR